VNLLKLTDEKLALLRQEVVNECGRRTRAAVEGLDPGQLVRGNELAKRAVVVAAAGKHSLLFMGAKNSGKTMLRAVAYALGLEEVFEFLPCPCGEYSDPTRACSCTIAQMTRHLSKLPGADISVEVFRPRERDFHSLGSSLADMQRQLAEAVPFEHVSMILPEVCQHLLRISAQEMSLDPVSRAAVLSVARTIATLDRKTEIGPAHLCEAINYRALRARIAAASPRRSKPAKRRVA